VVSQKPGVMIYGEHAASLPFLNGVLCVGPPLFRTGLIPSGGNPPPDDCSGVLSFAVTHAFLALHGWGAGTQLVAQFWYRDPLQADGTGAALSDGLTFGVCP